VTTQDWGIAGRMHHSVSGHAVAGPGCATHFVYKLHEANNDLAWLRSNIFGDLFAGHLADLDFLQRVRVLVPAQRTAHARTYWIWLLYAWPTKTPVGLKDKTLLAGTGAGRAPAVALPKALAVPL